jgi:hypothetical protein
VQTPAGALDFVVQPLQNKLQDQKDLSWLVLLELGQVCQLDPYLRCRIA